MLVFSAKLDTDLVQYLLFLSDPSPIIALPFQSLGHCSCCSIKLDLSKLWHGFLSLITWICQDWNMDFSKLLRGFIKVVLNAEWVKVLIALGPWQCLHLYSPGEKPKYKYNNTGPVLGVVGGSYDEDENNDEDEDEDDMQNVLSNDKNIDKVANLLRLFRIPQISPASTAKALSDKTKLVNEEKQLKFYLFFLVRNRRWWKRYTKWLSNCCTDNKKKSQHIPELLKEFYDFAHFW